MDGAGCGLTWRSRPRSGVFIVDADKQSAHSRASETGPMVCRVRTMSGPHAQNRSAAILPASPRFSG